MSSIPQPDGPDRLARRDVAALTEPMVVDEFDPALWNDDEVRVYSRGDARYVVNPVAEWCECGDFTHRNVRCKHIRRARYALGIDDIPEWVAVENVDAVLRRRLNKQLQNEVDQ